MGAVRVILPRSLRLYWDAPPESRVEAATVAQALAALDAGVRARVLDERGMLRPYVHLFVNDRGVTDLASPLKEGDAVRILPSVAGGSHG